MEFELEQEPAEAGFLMPEESEERQESPVDLLLRYADSQNIAAELDETTLNTLGQAVVREYQIDDSSLSDWRDTYTRAMDIARQAIEEKTYPWRRASNIKYPLITTAAIQFHARAYPAIVQGNNVAKGAVIGFDPTGEKAQRAERIGKHLSYQLLYEMEEWEEDTDKLLLILSITGCVFRKSYYSQSLGRNVSEMVAADRLVVNYRAKSLERAPRVTHLIELYPYEIEERVRSGTFIAQDFGLGVGEDDQAPEEFLEQHLRYDLDEDGYPEPYCVTVHKETGKVVRITARYDADSLFVDGSRSVGQIQKEVDEQNRQIQEANAQMAMQYRQQYTAAMQGMAQFPVEPQFIPQAQFSTEGMTIQRIEPIQYFTKYGFIPAIDGGFYDMGFGTLLLALNEAVNTNINMLLDAGHVANTGGGFIGSNLRLAKKTGGSLRFEPNEFKRVDTGGQAIRDSIYQMQFPGPSAVLFSLLGMMIEAARDVASVKDIMTGETSANMPATTTIALIEQGQQVFSSIYKRIHRALGKELKLLARLNARYLNPEVYFTVLDASEPAQVTLSDYQQGDFDVRPVSDPNLVTKQQRMALAQAMLPMAADPTMDGMEIKKEYLTAIGVENPERFYAKQPPPPPPEIIAEQAKAENERLKREIEFMRAQNEQRKATAEIVKMVEEIKVLRTQAIKNIAEAEAKEIGAQVDVYNAQREAFTSDIEGEASGATGVRADRGNSGMAGEPGNQAAQAAPGAGQGAMEQLPAGPVAGAGPAIAGPGSSGAGGEGGIAGGPVGPVV